MAIANKCDMCGKLYEPYNFQKNREKPNGIMLINIIPSGGYYDGKCYDCCPECMKAIMDTINYLKSPGKKEADIVEKVIEEDL